MELNQKKSATEAVMGGLNRSDFAREVAAMPLVRQSLEEFRRVTGLAAIIVPACPPKKPIRFGAQDNEFCRRVWDSCEGGCTDCHHTQTELFRRLDRKLRPQSLCCAGGIVQLAVPVISDGRHVATVLGGKVRVGLASEAEFNILSRRLGLENSARSLQQWREAYFGTRMLSSEQLRSAMRLLDVLARLLGEAVARRPPRVAPFESPYVAEARKYVAEHLGERLTTQQVSKTLNLSNAYFCRLFRRLTGMTFHAYLAQARVESVKAKLLSTTAPITEICYVSGFQSVSDFNRVFKARVGTSPSKFRCKAFRLRAETDAVGGSAGA